MADTVASLHEELTQVRRKMDALDQQVQGIAERQRGLLEAVQGNKEYKRSGLVDDLAALQAFVTEIKEFKGKAVGIALFITAVGLPVALWAAKNLDFIQHLFGK